jgi:hypothetical protein
MLRKPISSTISAMIQDYQELEAQLKALRPVAPSPEFADRLAAIGRRATGPLTADETALEASLRALTPAPLSDELERSILDRTSRVGAKVISLPTAHPTRRWGRLALPAAAAVALLGAATALLVPTGPRGGTAPGITAHHSGHNTASQPPAASPQRSVPLPALAPRFVPAGLDSRLRQANDEGVIWTAPDQPHRVLQVIYNDRVTVMDQDGRTYPVERPRVEYILLPEKID